MTHRIEITAPPPPDWTKITAETLPEIEAAQAAAQEAMRRLVLVSVSKLFDEIAARDAVGFECLRRHLAGEDLQ